MIPLTAWMEIINKGNAFGVVAVVGKIFLPHLTTVCRGLLQLTPQALGTGH